MGHLNSKDEITELLLVHLPIISESVSKIIDLIIPVISKDLSESNQLDHIASKVVIELENIIPRMVDLNNDVPFTEAKISGDEILIKYHDSMQEILSGLQVLLRWFKDEDLSSSELNSGVNSLFEGVHSTIKLVDLLIKE